jgi:hypothetical protein
LARPACSAGGRNYTKSPVLSWTEPLERSPGLFGILLRS